MNARVKIFAASFLALCTIGAAGELTIQQPSLEQRFADADEVCLCVYIGANEFQVANAYKGFTGSRSITLDDPGLPGSLLNRGDAFVLLFRHSSGSKRRLASPGAILNAPEVPHNGNADRGIDGLISDVSAALKTTQSEDPLLELLRLSGQFEALPKPLFDAVAAVSMQHNTKIRLEATTLSAKYATDPRLYVSRLIRDLLATPDYEPMDTVQLISVIATKAGPDDFESLTTLGLRGSSFDRISARMAMRRLESPAEIPFLLRWLDSGDVENRYAAVISLSEILRLGGDYGPTFLAYRQDESRYQKLWRDWLKSNLPVNKSADSDRGPRS